MTARILVVEDEEDLRETMRDALELHGYLVVCARDGYEALEMLDDLEHLSLILLDLVMPRLNGWDCLARIRERPDFNDVPVVVHTSVHERAAPSGVAGVLEKPVTLRELMAAVRKHCPSGGQHDVRVGGR